MKSYIGRKRDNDMVLGRHRGKVTRLHRRGKEIVNGDVPISEEDAKELLRIGFVECNDPGLLEDLTKGA